MNAGSSTSSPMHENNRPAIIPALSMNQKPFFCPENRNGVSPSIVESMVIAVGIDFLPNARAKRFGPGSLVSCIYSIAM